jgi:ectoine hydroxylase-related dioxygenase (phytanoyl-CoA dioxygenase family)
VLKLRDTAGQILNECRQSVRWLHGSGAPPRARDEAAQVGSALAELKRAGVVVIPGFLDRERCAELKRRVDAGLETYASFVQHDDSGADQRLFGLDVADAQIRDVTFNPFAMSVLQQYQRSSRYAGFALCARLTARPANPGSGQGWHRDSAAYKQTKCMIYLTDVGADNGPFQYVEGSHRPIDVVRCVARYGFGVNQYRFSDAEIAPLLAAEPSRTRILTAPAGTAILFDARGLHRGMPIVAGERYAITTYLWFDQPAPDHVAAWTVASQQRNGPMRKRVT